MNEDLVWCSWDWLGNPIWSLTGNRPCSQPGLPLGAFIGYASSICPCLHRTQLDLTSAVEALLSGHHLRTRPLDLNLRTSRLEYISCPPPEVLEEGEGLGGITGQKGVKQTGL